MHSKTEYNHRKALSKLSLAAGNEMEDVDLNIEIGDPFTNHRELDSNNHHFYPSLKLNYFKECTTVLNHILDQIDQLEEAQLNSSLVRFKKESVHTLSCYIEAARVEHNDAMEQSDMRNSNISSIISKRINLFQDLISDFEELEADIMEYFGY